MSDFIREVDEEYRRERVANFLRRYQVPLALIVVLVIAGAGGWRWYHDRQVTRAENANASYQDAQTQARDGKVAEAEAAFKALAANGPSGYAELSRLRAAEVLGATDPEAAARQLDAIASADDRGSPALRDLARYRGALLRIGTQDSKAFDAQYGRFALESFAFHDGMRELLALAALQRGDAVAANKYLLDILTDPLAPPGARNRAQAFRELANAGPATPIASAPAPAAVTSATPAAPSQFAPIGPPPAMPPLPSGEAQGEAQEAAPSSTGQPAEAPPPAAPGSAAPAAPLPPAK